MRKQEGFSTGFSTDSGPLQAVGLLPAAGYARRLPGQTESKEILPVWKTPEGRMAPAAACSLTQMATAGIRLAHIVVRDGKRDVENTLANGGEWGIALRYHYTPPTPDPVTTLAQAHHALAENRVALAFPDILSGALDPFSRLLHELERSECDCVLGLFPRSTTQPADPVVLDAEGRIGEILPKHRHADTSWSWGMAVWTPVMSAWIHRFAQAAGVPDRPGPANTAGPGPERSIGAALDAGRREGLQLAGIPVWDRPFLDIGTPSGLDAALRGSWSAG